jgi:hypothetical protein
MPAPPCSVSPFSDFGYNVRARALAESTAPATGSIEGIFGK